MRIGFTDNKQSELQHTSLSSRTL